MFLAVFAPLEKVTGETGDDYYVKAENLHRQKYYRQSY